MKGNREHAKKIVKLCAGYIMFAFIIAAAIIGAVIKGVTGAALMITALIAVVALNYSANRHG